MVSQIFFMQIMDGLTYYHWFHYDTLLINNFIITVTDDKDHVAEKKTNLWIDAFYSQDGSRKKKKKKRQ